MKEKPLVVIDERERNSKIPELLVKKGVSIKFKQLLTGDYIISDRIVIERKTIRDFIKSIFDGRLFNQIKRLKDLYEIPIVIVEGDFNEIYFLIDNPNIFRGSIVSLVIYFNAKIFYTSDEKETAEFISIIAKKERNKKEIIFPIVKGKPKIENIKQWQNYIIQSFPFIGPKYSDKLLNKFKTIKNIINAEEKEIAKILGEKRTKRFLEIINKKYEEKEKKLI